jgi:hypothetical protein
MRTDGILLTVFVKNLDLLCSTCQHILVEDLNMRQIAAKCIPSLLNDDQQQNRLLCVQGPITAGQKYRSFLPKVITGNESCVYGYGNIQELSQIFILNDKLCWTASLNSNSRDVFCSERGTGSVV